MGRRKQRIFATYKKRGEWVELLFMTLAAERGFNVSKPFGDSAPYDVSLEREGRFLRVQVKSSDYWNGSGYFCSLHGFDQRLYGRDEIDYFAIYIVPEKVWYIFPVTRLEGMSGVAVAPHRKKHKYARYKEAWWKLLQHHFRRGKRTVVPSEEKKVTLSTMNGLSRRVVERLNR